LSNLILGSNLGNSNFDGSELDVFETLDFDTRPGLMGMFTDATMLASNLFTYDLDGVNQP